MKLCECGCGAPVKRRFRPGHWARTYEGRRSAAALGMSSCGSRVLKPKPDWRRDGDHVDAIHRWVARQRGGYTGICELCGDEPHPITIQLPGKKSKKQRGTVLHFKREGWYTYEYLRDYIEICKRCHGILHG